MVKDTLYKHSYPYKRECWRGVGWGTQQELTANSLLPGTHVPAVGRLPRLCLAANSVPSLVVPIYSIGAPLVAFLAWRVLPGRRNVTWFDL
jgi:hypothetical protein